MGETREMRRLKWTTALYEGFETVAARKARTSFTCVRRLEHSKPLCKNLTR